MADLPIPFPDPMRLRPVLLAALPAAVLLAAAATWMLGSVLTAVTPHAVTLDDANTQAVLLRAAPDQLVAGTLFEGKGQGAVLLLHGNRSDRRQMAQRARFLQRHGYTALLIDLPGQGASTASAVTFGLREAHGVHAALDELRRRAPGQRIGVIGVSLGAAALVLCRDCGQVDAVVLESMYPTIEEAVADRIRMVLGSIATPLAHLLLWQLPLRLDIRPDQLRPIERLPGLGAPVLIAAGSAFMARYLRPGSASEGR
jgi:pimeloyl-ACP methyl ester carboxylesterase